MVVPGGIISYLTTWFCSSSISQDSCSDLGFHLKEVCCLFLWMTNQESSDTGNLCEYLIYGLEMFKFNDEERKKGAKR